MAIKRITTNLIEDGSIGTIDIANNAIVAAKITDGNITTAKLADLNVTAGKLAGTLDLTGKTITVATATTGDSDTSPASTAFVQQEIAALVDSSPSSLNTLNELAAALGDDASFSTTVTNSIATKLPLAGGTMTGDLKVGATIASTGGTTNNRGILLAHQNNTNQSYVGRSENGVTDTGNRITFDYDNDKMQLDSDGDIILTPTSNVGIGTASPAFETGNGLEIRNSSGNGSHLKLTDNASGTGATQGFDLYMFNGQGYIENYENAPTVFRNNGSEVMRIRETGAIEIKGSSTTSQAQGFITNDNSVLTIGSSVSGSVVKDIAFNSPSTMMYIDGSTGNVGIGTSSPDNKLHVNSTSSGIIAKFTGPNDYNAESGLEFSVGRAKISGFLNGSGGTPGTSLRFYTMPNGGSVTERMRIDSSGRVGIGTNNPQTSTKGLHVVHDANEGTPSFPSGEVIIAQRNFNSSQGCHIGIIGGSASDSAINFGDKDNSDAGIIRYHHNGDFLGFTTNTTEHWKMFANGSFQPTQQHTKDIGGVNAEVRNIYAQGLYVGGSAAANKLDDYEEGTWTPTINSGTMGSGATGTYTKVGRLVTVTYYIFLTTMGGSTTPVQVGGLPFTSGISGNTGSHSAGSILCRYFTKNQIVSYVPAGVNYIAFYNNSSSNWDQITFGEIEATHDNDFEAHGTLQYIV